MRITEWATRDPHGLGQIDHGTLLVGICEALSEIERLRAALDAANDRFARLNSPTGREIELRIALQRIERIEGCECDEGYTCGLCKVRRIARDAIDEVAQMEFEQGKLRPPRIVDDPTA